MGSQMSPRFWALVKAGRLGAPPGHRRAWDLARQRVGSTQVRRSHPEPALVFQNPNCQLCPKQQDGSWR